MNIDAFKDAFGVRSEAAGWADQARTATAQKLDGLRRLLAGWEGAAADAYREAADAFLAELAALPADPTAALAACALLGDDISLLEGEARAARQEASAEAHQQWLDAEARLQGRIAALDREIVAAEVSTLSGMLAEARGSAAQCAFPLAHRICAEITAGCEEAEAIAQKGAQARKEQWQCVAQNMLSLRALGVPDALESDMLDLQLRATRIQGLISERQFDLAIELCVHFVLEVERITALTERHRRWAQAHQVLLAQGAHPLLDASAQAALWRDFDRAMALLEDALLAIDAARREATQREGIADVLGSVEEVSAALGGEHAGQRARIERLAQQVRGALAEDLGRAARVSARLEAALVDALESPDDRSGSFAQALGALRGQLPGGDADLAGRLAAVEALGATDEGFAALDDLAEAVVAAAAAAEARAACEKLLDEADLSLSSLEFYDHTPDSEARLEALLARLDAAREQVEAGAFEAAEAALQAIASEAEAEMVSLDLRAGDPADASLQMLLARPGGAARLDKIVEESGAVMTDTGLEEAIQSRFGIELHVEAGSGDAAPSLERIYSLLSSVPEAHVKDNPHLKEVIFHADADDMSSYLEGAGQVTLRCGRAEAPRAVLLLDEAGQAALDPDHRPVEGASATHFDWSTLHEVGHAVEHKLGFMKQHAGDAGYGGWTEHGADVTEISRQAAAALGFDADYIAQRLRDRPAPTPPAPATVEEGVWRQRQAAVERWCAQVRGPLWDSHAQSAAAAISGMVYHEAYPGRWVSYPIGARSKATSGYQFRSPIEWFAELYAAYHAGLLSPSHSARAWLEAL